MSNFERDGVLRRHKIFEEYDQGPGKWPISQIKQIWVYLFECALIMSFIEQSVLESKM